MDIQDLFDDLPTLVLMTIVFMMGLISGIFLQ